MNKKELDKFEKNIEKSVNSEMPNKKNNYDISKNTTKDQMSKIPWLISFFLIVVISIVACSKFLNSNPQTIFTVAIDKLFSSMADNIDDNAYTISKGKINIKYDIKGSKEIYQEISKNDFDIDYVYDSSNNKSFYKINTKYENTDTLSFNIYNNKKDTYIFFNNIYDKYIKLDNSKTYNIKNKDIKSILNGLNQAIDKVATSEKINSNRTDLDYYIKTIKTYELKLIINKDNYKIVTETFINSLKSNEEFINSLAKVLNVSSSVTKTKLEKIQQKLEMSLKEAGQTEVILYADRRTNDFIKGSINNKLGTLELLKKDSTYVYNLSNTKNKVKADGELKIESNKKKTKSTITLNMNYSNENDNLQSNFNIRLTNNKSNSFKNVNIKNYVQQKDISEVDKFMIYSKILEKENIKNLIEFIK